MKNLSGILIAICLLIGFLFFVKQQNKNLVKENEALQSGAYQALNFFGLSRIYPNEKLPEKAENKQLAWEKYVILISKYGVTFAEYSKMVLELKKNLEIKSFLKY